MKKKLSTYVYPIIVACICLVVGIVMFSVALALKWGTTCAVLQLYAWMTFAGVCIVLSVFLKFNAKEPLNGSDGGSAENGGTGDEGVAAQIHDQIQAIKNELDEVQKDVREIHNAVIF